MILGVWSRLTRMGGSWIDLDCQKNRSNNSAKTGANKTGLALVVDATGPTKCDN